MEAEYYMDKKKIKRIVKNCNKGIDQAENEVKKLSSKEIIELKAKLKGRSVHLDKWILILIPFISMAIATLAVIINVPGVDKSWIGILAVVLLTASIIFLIIHITNQFAKEKDLVTLSYLEEYANFSKEIESYEQIEKRQKDERKRLLEAWKKRAEYANEQVASLEGSLEDTVHIQK